MKIHDPIDRMFKRDQKKFIFPVMYYGLLDAYILKRKKDLTTQMRYCIIGTKSKVVR